MPEKLHIAVVAGTRPEVIKLAPVIMALRSIPYLRTTLIVTGQHREMLNQALSSFDLVPDINLNVMTSNQTLSDLTSMIVTHTHQVLAEISPDWVLVQGDTTTAFAAALASFYLKIKIGHIEAGLRTYNNYNPFPEEMNRRLIAPLANLHFAPTLRAKNALLAEGVPARCIFQTGNTVVDALEYLQNRRIKPSKHISQIVSLAKGRLILVTCHRRESFGADLEAILDALVELTRTCPDYRILFPIHLNPNLRAQVLPRLVDFQNIIISEPIVHSDVLYALQYAQLVITDSGGIQEEAPSFGVPVIVIRHTTERPEGIDAGFARLVPPDADAIVAQTKDWLENDKRSELQGLANPYGDGLAATRIVKRLIEEHR